MKYVLIVLLSLASTQALADDCSNKAFAGVQALAKVNHFRRLFDLKVTGTNMTEGGGLQLLISARDLHDHPYSFEAIVAQSEGPCELLGISLTEHP